MLRIKKDVIEKKRKECEQVTEEEIGGEPGTLFRVSFSFPLAEHNGITLRNLVHLIYSRSALLNKATGGHFNV